VVLLIRKNDTNMLMLIPEYVGIWNQDRQQQYIDLSLILLTYFDAGTLTK